jgi:D-alanine-D-alanine ligase
MSDTTKTVNVVMGGPSAEHEISLRSGREVLRHLDRGSYRIRAVVISPTRDFYWCDIEGEPPPLEVLRAPAGAPSFAGPLHPAATAPLWEGVEVAFLALHGAFGEDGLFQGYLDTIGIPYTGSGVFASAVGMNKIATKQLFIQNGLSTPPYSVWGRDFPDVTVESLVAAHGVPCFAKCPQSGSSRLMGRAGSAEELAALLSELNHASSSILVEPAISGTEYSCAVVEHPDGTHQALPPVLIVPSTGSFFDYEAKYTDGACEEVVPAPCDDELARRIRDTALRAHRVLGCSGLSRTDMILAGDSLQVLEVNTLPGLTPNSLAPKAFAAAGGTYGELLDILIETAATRNRTEHS